MIARGRKNPERRRSRRLRQGMIKTLPSLLTLGNLWCGFAAIFYASRSFDAADKTTYVLGGWSPLTVAAALIFFGMLFDAFDGRVARMTRQTSSLGEQLDSMADMVSCGVAPAFLLIQFIRVGTPFVGHPSADTLYDRAGLLVAAIYVGCCALRLARFNAEIDQPEEADHASFKGMPSPAAAGTLASLVLLHQSLMVNLLKSDAAGSPSLFMKVVAVAMVFITLLVALAMVSTIRYPHVLNKYLKRRAPFRTLVIAMFVLVPLALFPQITLAAVFTVNAVVPPVMLLFRRRPVPAALGAPAPGVSDPPSPAEVSDEQNLSSR